MNTQTLLAARATLSNSTSARRASRRCCVKRLALAAGLTLLPAAQVDAQILTKTWQSTATSNSWSVAANWSPSGAVVSSPDLSLVFNDLHAAGIVNNNIAANFQLNQFNFGNSIALQLRNNSVRLVQSSAAAGSLLPTINHTGTATVTFDTMPVVLGANTTINKSSTANLVFTTAITENGGARSLTLAAGNVGQINFDGVNTFTGGLIIDGGTVRATNDSATGGSLGNGTVTLNGGELRISNGAGTNLTLDATRQIILGNGVLNSNGQSLNINGVLSGLNLIKANGGGTLTINNSANTYTGDTDVRQGTLKIGTGANLPATTTVKLGFTTTNGTLDLNGTNQTVAGLLAVGNTAASQIIGNSSLTTDSVLTFSSAGSSNFGGTIQNVIGTGTRTVALTVAAGTLNLSGNNSYTGGTIVNSGATLILGDGNTAGAIAGNVANAGTFGINRSDSYTFAGNITGGGNFAKAGTGLAALTGTNTFSTVALTAGTLRVQPSALGGSPAVTVASGAALEVFNPTATTSVPVSSLTLGADALSTNTLNLLLNGNPTGAALAVASSGGLLSNGTTTINVGNGAIPLSLGLKPLISYVGAVGGTSNASPDYGFVLGTLPTRAIGSLDTTTPGLVQLNITSIDTIKWTGTDGTNPTFWDINTTTNWALTSNSTPTNYLETAPPGDSVTFDASGAVKTVNLQTIVSPAAMIVNTSGGDYTFTGTGGIAGSGSLVKNGAGTLHFENTGANTFSGGTTVNAGNVRVGNGTDSSSLAGNVALAATTKLELNPGSANVTLPGNITGAGAVELLTNAAVLTGTGNTYGGGTTIASGATLQIGDGVSSGSLPAAGLVNNGTLAFNPGTLGYVYAGNITGGALSILGSGRTTTLTGTGNTFTGGTTVAAGATLQIGDGATSNGSLPGNADVTGTLSFRPLTSYTFGGDITGGGQVRGLSGSTLLNGALLYAGTTTVNSGATLQLGDGTKTVGITGNVTNNGTLAINAATGNLTYGGVISGSGGVNMLGGGFTLNAANTYTGPTTVAAGVTVNAGIANSLSASTILDLAAGATFNANDFNSRAAGLTGAGNINLGTNPATLFTINGNNVTTYNGVISGAGGISRVDGGTLILTAPQTYMGNTNIQNDSATIRITADNVLPTGTTLTFNGTSAANSVFDLNGKNQSIAALTSATTTGSVYIQNDSGAGTSVLTITNGAGVWGNAITSGFSRIRDNDGVAVGGNVALTVNGGIFTVKDVQLYTGPTTINSGATYKLAKDAAVSSVSDWTINGSGTLDIVSFNGTLQSLTGNGIATGTTGILSVISGNFSGIITGAIGLTKANAGTTFTVTGTANTFTGKLRTNNGTMEVYSLGDVGAGSNGTGEIQILNGTTATATFRYLGPAVTITRPIAVTGNGTSAGSAIFESSGTGPLTINAGASRINTGTGLKTLVLSGTNTGLNSLNGVITNGVVDPLGLGKSGVGTWRISGTNNYTGPTTVTAGKLIIDGNNSAATGAVTVAALATLAGSGTIGGATTVASTGIVAPGSSAGNLLFINGLDFSAGGVYSWELAALSTDGTTPGLNFDLITVSGGNLALSGTSALTLDFGLLPATGPNSADAFWTTSKSWKIIDVSGTGTNTGDTNLSTITNATYSSGTFSTTVGTDGDAGDIFLVFTPGGPGSPSIWQGANNDNWTAAGSWSGSVPNSASAEAKFVTTGGTTAILDANQTVNKLTFDATAPHTISGASTLTLAGTTPMISTAGTNTATQTVAVNLDLAAGTAINVQGGTLELNSPANATLGAGVTATVANGATLSLGGAGNALSNGGSTHANVANSGTLAATTPGKRVGNIDGTGTTTVTTANATLTANHVRQGTLNIGAGNTVTIANNGTDTATSVVTSLNINATGKLDLNDNDLIVKNGNITTLTAQLATGLDINGNYGGGPGITSTAFANNMDFNTVLGIAANSDLGYTSFSSQTVGINDVLIKYTYYGDADLSGSVDTSTDFDLYITGLTSGGSLGGWLFGDFDYSGTVDSSTDFDLYITGLTSQGSPLLTAGGGGGNLVQAVPEPSTLVLGGLALLGFAGVGIRRRRMAQQ